MRVSITIFIALIFVAVSFIHGISDDSFASINWKSDVSKGEVERQKYIQTVYESGTILYGDRSETKMTAMQTPRFTISLRIPSYFGEPKKVKRIYNFGLSSEEQDKQNFKAKYTYIRLWLIESALALLIVILWVDKIISLIKSLLNSSKKQSEQVEPPEAP